MDWLLSRLRILKREKRKKLSVKKGYTGELTNIVHLLSQLPFIFYITKH